MEKRGSFILLSHTPSPPPSPSPSFFFCFVFVLFVFFVLLSNLLAITRAERERSGKRRSGLYNLEVACVQTSPISFVARGKGTFSACNKGNRRRLHAGNLEGEQTRINITTGPRYHLILR